MHLILFKYQYMNLVVDIGITKPILFCVHSIYKQVQKCKIKVF